MHWIGQFSRQRGSWKYYESEHVSHDLTDSNTTSKKMLLPSVISLEQFHQHSSLPPEVTPHFGWLWRIFRFLVVAILLLCSFNSSGTFEEMFTKSNSPWIRNARRRPAPEPMRNVGFINIDIMATSNISENGIFSVLYLTSVFDWCIIWTIITRAAKH